MSVFMTVESPGMWFTVTPKYVDVGGAARRFPTTDLPAIVGVLQSSLG
jgi:hypothetical protein